MGKTIMFVDDSTTMRQLVVFTLKDAGYSVVEAVNGKDALSKIPSVKIDMLITDLNMPEMDGMQLIKAFRSMGGYRFTPAFILTTENHADKKAEASKAGATGWMVKPFVPQNLIGLIQKFLN